MGAGEDQQEAGSGVSVPCVPPGGGGVSPCLGVPLDDEPQCLVLL